MDIQRIRRYMKTWAEYTYAQGVDYCRNNTTQEKQQGKTILQLQNLSDKLMNGNSVEGIPIKYEGALRNISYSGIFYDALENGYLTPASYVMEIMCDCNSQSIHNERLVAGIIGRGLRSLPAFIREMDLAAKLLDRLDGAECYRGKPEDDIAGHTDIFLKYRDETYRLWSYQNSSERALTNTVSKVRGQRGQLPVGIYILCPFDYRDRNQYEDVCGWRLYNEDYSERVEHLIIEGEIENYEEIRDRQYSRMKNYVSHMQMFKKQ
ncbi:MAG: hypothetical protein E7300_12035 [Lachnospiraceae bacterium]|nr:hypothetical protein [Lachnospiraceae bacterium]